MCCGGVLGVWADAEVMIRVAGTSGIRSLRSLSGCSPIDTLAVLAEVLGKEPVFVKIVQCPAQQMNALEKKLIKAFNATSSYNNTAGGSRRR